jgi:hypothetical protein
MADWIAVYYRITRKTDTKRKRMGLSSIDFNMAKDKQAPVLIVALRVVMDIYDMAAQMLGWSKEKYLEELEKFKKEVSELSIGEPE